MWFCEIGKKRRCSVKSNSEPCARCEGEGIRRFHMSEKDELFRLLREMEEPLPDGGDLILNYFLDTEGHISTSAIQEGLKKAGHKFDIEFINKVLDILCRYGIAQRIYLDGDVPWYEHLHLGSKHDHLLCPKCGKVTEFNSPEIGELIREISGGYDFEPLSHKLTIIGLCPACKRASRAGPGMPLSMAASGEKLKVERLIGGYDIRHRLTAMGISPGEEIEVVSNCGPIIINLKGSRLAVGRGLAQKIMVSQTESRGH
ncbi:MAG: FeoA domain-containing protein [Dissulfurimicrobium sp.]|uniref:FeoA domain-containing protein n=1 Tax=Dissulfurimicrobium sp. TaxID=2022436 RepID=UPI003D13C254